MMKIVVTMMLMGQAKMMMMVNFITEAIMAKMITKIKLKMMKLMMKVIIKLVLVVT